MAEDSLYAFHEDGDNKDNCSQQQEAITTTEHIKQEQHSSSSMAEMDAETAAAAAATVAASIAAGKGRKGKNAHQKMSAGPPDEEYSVTSKVSEHVTLQHSRVWQTYCSFFI